MTAALSNKKLVEAIDKYDVADIDESLLATDLSKAFTTRTQN